jgi:hypothetical protein
LTVSIKEELRLLVILIQSGELEKVSTGVVGSDENSLIGIVTEDREGGCSGKLSGTISGKRIQNAMFQLRTIIFRCHLQFGKSLLKTIGLR